MCAALIAAPMHNSSEWQSFSPADAGFSVMFPATPQQSSLHTPTAAGTLKTLTASVNDSSRNSFLVSWTVYATPNADVARNARTLERATHALMESRGGTVVSEEAVSIGAISGRQATFKLDDGRAVQVRFFLVGNRFFQVMTETKDDVSRAMAERFLASFELKG